MAQIISGIVVAWPWAVDACDDAMEPVMLNARKVSDEAEKRHV